MAEKRRLLNEMDKCFKKVDEGFEIFDEIMSKMSEANSDNQREKFQDDLKKEIKKLQRLRDQIKGWQNSSEIKDKEKLSHYRKLIEQRMETFKEIERENKTKPHSKQGLSAEDKLDPKEKEKSDAIEWLNNQIRRIQDEVDRTESKLESMTSAAESSGGGTGRKGRGKKEESKKNEKEKIEELKKHLERVKFHLTNLEVVMRLITNEKLEIKEVLTKLKEPVEMYIEALDPDSEFDAESLDPEDIYEELKLSSYIPQLGGFSIGSADEDGKSLGGENGGSPPPSGSNIREGQKDSNQSVQPHEDGGGETKSANAYSAATKSAVAAPLKLIRLGSRISAESCSLSSPPPQTPPPPPSIPYNTIAAGGVAASGATTTSAATATTAVTQPTSATTHLSAMPSVTTHSQGAPLNHQTVTQMPASTTSSTFSISLPTCGSTPIATTASTCTSFSTNGGTSSTAWTSSMPSTPSAVASAVGLVVASVAAAAASATSSVVIPSTIESSVTNSTQHTQRQAQTTRPVSPNQQQQPLLQRQKNVVEQSPQAQQQIIHQQLQPLSQPTMMLSDMISNSNNTSMFATSALNSNVNNSTLAGMTGFPPISTSTPLLPTSTVDSRASQQQPLHQRILQPLDQLQQQQKLSTPQQPNVDELNQSMLRHLRMSKNEERSTQPQTTTIQPRLGASPLGPVPITGELEMQRSMLEAAMVRAPVQMDSEKPRTYLHKMPCQTPPYYPQAPLLNADSLEYYLRLLPETLFFTFYYMEGSRAQLLAAKALKKLSWRFHTKLMMWFQRHEEPKQITDDFEQGTYVYFDFEKWTQRKWEQFTFEYKYLEDKEFE